MSVSPARIAGHVAPLAIAVAYVAWFAWTRNYGLADRLLPVQLFVALLALFGGVRACWLPSGLRWREVLIVFSFVAALALFTARIEASGSH